MTAPASPSLDTIRNNGNKFIPPQGLFTPVAVGTPPNDTFPVGQPVRKNVEKRARAQADEEYE
jgi:hypothetical protein